MTATPNILLLTDDQHRWDFYDKRSVSCLRTPTLSRLMREGTTLTHAYTNCPICMPTRFTWVHGLYASQAHGMLLANSHDWPSGLPSMPQALQKEGYHTALVGKLHSLAGLYHRDVLEYEEDTRARGFDDVYEVCGKSLAFWYDCHWTRHLARKGLIDAYRRDIQERGELCGGYGPCRPGILAPEDTMDGFVRRHVCAWLDQYDKDQPFFLHASFCGPHFPIDPPESYFERYRAEDMPPPEGVEDTAQIDYWQHRRAAYCAMIEQLDDEFACVLESLAARKDPRPTLVIFGTDHGDMMGHRNEGHKGPPYDTSTRTPYVLWMPGQVPAGTELDGMAEAADLPATILEAAGLGDDARAHMPDSPGRSFWRYATGECDAHREWSFAEMGGEIPWRMVRERDWKYVFHAGGGESLFDMQADPWELHNLADDPAVAIHRDRLRGRLLESLMSCTAANTRHKLPRDDWFLPATWSDLRPNMKK